MVDEDHFVYVKLSKESFLILSLYVDDILLAGNDKELIVTIMTGSSFNFEMKDMSEISYVLLICLRKCTLRKLLNDFI